MASLVVLKMRTRLPWLRPPLVSVLSRLTTPIEGGRPYVVWKALVMPLVMTIDLLGVSMLNVDSGNVFGIVPSLLRS